MHSCPDGYATGSKDGTVILWDSEFKQITKVDLANNPIGYKGNNEEYPLVILNAL